MNPAKCDKLDYIHFMIAAQRVFTCTEAAHCQPQNAQVSSHEPSPACSPDSLQIPRRCGRRPRDWSTLKVALLVLDDTTLDKSYARNTQLVTRHWSGKHHRVVLGINLISLLWTDGEALSPTDFRVYDKPIGGKNKNQHFRDVLDGAKGRGPDGIGARPGSL